MINNIWVHHVGGIGDCGPVEAFGKLGQLIGWVLYDADVDSLMKNLSFKPNCKLINGCIGNIDGKAKFHILKNASASSMMLPAEKAKKFGMPNTEISWGEHTELIETKEIVVNRLDTLVKSGMIPQIDFLSIDAQGADLDIIKGADITNTLGICCEVEFNEIYENQPLFCDIQKYLKEKGFILCDIQNMQYWNYTDYPKIIGSKGFLTVGEAIFLRDPETIQDTNQLIKLAIIGLVFNQSDFSISIVKRLKEQGVDIDTIIAENPRLASLRLLRSLSEVMSNLKKINYG